MAGQLVAAITGPSVTLKRGVKKIYGPDIELYSIINSSQMRSRAMVPAPIPIARSLAE